MKEGRVTSCNEDPLCLAIKEYLRDYSSPRDMVSIGDDSVFLAYKGKNWICYYDILNLYKHTTYKSRSIRLVFKNIPPPTIDELKLSYPSSWWKESPLLA